MPLRRAALLLVLLACSCARWRSMSERFGGETLSIDAARIASGSEARGADPALDDSAWPQTVLWSLTPQPLWIRKHVEVTEPHQLGLYVGLLASYEVWWDGRLVGRNGSASTAGPIDQFFPIDASAPGPHLLAIRILPGPTRETRGFFQGIALGDYAHLVRSRIRAQLIPLAALGVFLVIGVYYLSIWFAASRRAPVLIFSLLCFAAALLVTAETWRWIVGYTYDWHIVRMEIILGLTFSIAFLLPLFFVLELAVPRPRVWLGAAAAALIVIAVQNESFDDRCLKMFWTSIAVSAAAVAAAIPRRRWDVLPFAIGISVVGAALVAGGYGFSDSSFFIAFCALIVCLLVSLAMQMRRQRREHESALLRAARLEIELLKKSIQPHFLMNTLTAVMEWIEEDPREGMRFLEALADELRIFGEVAGERLIPAGREVELCRSHLAIMSCRKGTRFALETVGVDAGAALPPAIFHTLLENAITHNGYGGEEVVFTLREERAGDARRYVLDAPLDCGGGATAFKAAADAAALQRGLGLRYVKARLEESFPGRWRIDSAPHEASWRTTIEVTL